MKICNPVNTIISDAREENDLKQYNLLAKLILFVSKYISASRWKLPKLALTSSEQAKQNTCFNSKNGTFPEAKRYILHSAKYENFKHGCLKLLETKQKQKKSGRVSDSP